jgi:5-methylcytosine-specific restriction enzyme subunit McrC
MQTNITLEPLTRKIMMDIKFYQQTFQSYHGKMKVHSAHLYQMYTYLTNASQGNRGKRIEGILLYPTLSEYVSLTYPFDIHILQICTVNLNQLWQNIHQDLLTLLR